MLKSQVASDTRYTFNEDRWIVSMLATGDKTGGHAKIVVEGLNNDTGWLTDKGNNPTGSNLFIAEYHIIPDTNPFIQNSIIPPALINTKCKFGIYFTERSEYKADKIKQYAESTSKSWRINKERAMRMINAIKKEQADYDLKYNYQAYQFAGKYRIFGSNDGHNCDTWCEEKLAIADIKTVNLPFDWLKAAPVKHAHPLTKILDKTEEDFDNNKKDSNNNLVSRNPNSYWCKKMVPPLVIGTTAVALAAIVFTLR